LQLFKKNNNKENIRKNANWDFGHAVNYILVDLKRNG